MPDGACAHIAAITTVRHAKRRECEECVKIGAQWVHLRTCQECGTTQCCDDSPNRHASKHARARSEERRVGKECRCRWEGSPTKENKSIASSFICAACAIR